MEDIEENSFQQTILVSKPNNAQLHQSQQHWEEEPMAKYVCRLCKKTFYNANALQNHKNTQHNAHDFSSEDDKEVANPSNEQNSGGFKFIPLKSGENDEKSTLDGLTTRLFSVDTSYIIVKVEDDIDMDAIKRSRLDGVVKRAQLKPKQAKLPNLTVDLRGPFTCTFPSTLRPDLQCRQIFFNCCEYSLHYREEHTKRRKAALRCQVCEQRLDRDIHSESAIAQIQAMNRLSYSCRICGLTFLDGAEYDEHNRLVHAKMKPHQCSICAKRFTQQGGLQQHMRMHTGMRPFACTFCPKAFTQKAGLEQHLRTHTKVKPFKCVVCSKCFSQSVHLRQHMRTHTNIQPFECTVCGRRFKQSSHLNFHMRSHIGEGTLAMDRYVQTMQHNEQMEFLNFSKLQPVQDGHTLYYAAELATPLSSCQSAFPYQSQAVISESILSI
ncbi:zinc finger protein Xfin isoform X2 [Manduca sexta]|nr:zinc finger protein Xfin isoform X2 [Manduca sexta]KAG6454106.1 hypothetical protein O3G_MSEX008501 [Manduca sexta]